MNIKLLVLFFSLMLSVIACSSENECFVADAVTQVKKINIKGGEYFIYLRIAGFNKKESFYELYGSEPKFDLCGKSDTLAISDTHIDSTEGIVEQLVVDDLKLTVVYTKNGTQDTDYKNIPIKIK